MSALHPTHVFADTSFYYAFLDPRDLNYPLARQIAEWLGGSPIRLVSTWDIVVETVTLLRYRHSYQGAMTFIREILPSLQIVSLAETDRQEALRLFEKFSADKKISLCDIISYHVIKKYLKGIPFLAFDEDFQALGLTPFKIP